MKLEEWLKQNIFNIVYLVVSTAALYITLKTQIVINQQKIFAMEDKDSDMVEYMVDMKKDLKDEINKLERKIDDYLQTCKTTGACQN